MQQQWDEVQIYIKSTLAKASSAAGTYAKTHSRACREKSSHWRASGKCTHCIVLTRLIAMCSRRTARLSHQRSHSSILIQ